MSADQDITGRLAALEARLAELEDEREIRELMSRYGYYADAKLDDEYFELFTQDCVMDISTGRQPDPYEVERWEGVQTLKDWMADRLSTHDNGFYGNSLHMQGNNLAVAVDGDVATGSSYTFIFHQDGPDLKLISASINAWKFRREDGRWKIQERRRRRVGAPDSAEVLRVTES